MLRISNAEFEKTLEAVRERIFLSLRNRGFDGSEIEAYRRNWKDTDIGLNWASIGTVGKEGARAFAAAMLEAVEAVSSVEKAEIDWSIREE